MRIACSTSWHGHRLEDGAAALRLLMDIGFDHVELGHGIRAGALPGMLRVIEKGKVAVSSIHNFCPQPVEVPHDAPDCLEFTDYNPARRDRAVRLTCETIDLASRVGARAVVLHLGSVRHAPFEKHLVRLVASGAPAWGREAVAIKLKGLARREDVAPVYWKRIFECLDRIVPHARERGVRLGVECRASALEFPLEDEFDLIWKRYAERDVGYWHDFGHMQRKHNLGLGNHWEALSRQYARLVGAHFHDTVPPVQDHRPPGCGSVHWPLLMGGFPTHVPWVLELHPGVERSDVQSSGEFLRRWWEARARMDASLPTITPDQLPPRPA